MSGKRVYSDQELIDGIRKDDQQALGVLYKTYYPMVQHLILSNSGSIEEAKDIYQETIVIFYEKNKEAHFILNCKIKTYLYSVARRLWLKKLNEKSNFSGSLEENEIAAELGDNQLPEKEREIRYAAMHQCLEQLGDPCKSLLRDFYLFSQSMEQISEKFGYTNADNAKTQKYKCLQRLKALFFGRYKPDDYLKDDYLAKS